MSYNTNMTRRQANAIYRAVMQGDIVCDSDFPRYMYGHVDGTLPFNSTWDGVQKRLKDAVDELLSYPPNYAEAQNLVSEAEYLSGFDEE